MEETLRSSMYVASCQHRTVSKSNQTDLTVIAQVFIFRRFNIFSRSSGQFLDINSSLLITITFQCLKRFNLHDIFMLNNSLELKNLLETDPVYKRVSNLYLHAVSSVNKLLCRFKLYKNVCFKTLDHSLATELNHKSTRSCHV